MGDTPIRALYNYKDRIKKKVLERVFHKYSRELLLCYRNKFLVLLNEFKKIYFLLIVSIPLQEAFNLHDP